MKKSLIVLFAFCLMMVFYGCSPVQTETTTTLPSSYSTASIVSSDVISEPASSVATENPVELQSLVPQPETLFKGKDVTIEHVFSDSVALFMVKGYSLDEYKNYVAACKKMDWPKIVTDVNSKEIKMFAAYSSDKKYYMQANVDGIKNIIYISCQVSTKK